MEPVPGSGKETILLVEDDGMVRDVIQEILALVGYNVLTAINGRDALKVCEGYSGPIDLLLTDMVMPLMHGAQLADKLKPIYPAMRILYISGYLNDEALKLVMLDDRMEFIGKPVPANLLASKVRQVLDGATR